MVTNAETKFASSVGGRAKNPENLFRNSRETLFQPALASGISIIRCEQDSSISIHKGLSQHQLLHHLFEDLVNTDGFLWPCRYLSNAALSLLTQEGNLMPEAAPLYLRHCYQHHTLSYQKSKAVSRQFCCSDVSSTGKLLL